VEELRLRPGEFVPEDGLALRLLEFGIRPGFLLELGVHLVRQHARLPLEVLPQSRLELAGLQEEQLLRFIIFIAIGVMVGVEVDSEGLLGVAGEAAAVSVPLGGAVIEPCVDGLRWFPGVQQLVTPVAVLIERNALLLVPGGGSGGCVVEGSLAGLGRLLMRVWRVGPAVQLQVLSFALLLEVLEEGLDGEDAIAAVSDHEIINSNINEQKSDHSAPMRSMPCS
jgi:hypothetical protein